MKTYSSSYRNNLLIRHILNNNTRKHGLLFQYGHFNGSWLISVLLFIGLSNSLINNIRSHATNFPFNYTCSNMHWIVFLSPVSNLWNFIETWHLSSSIKKLCKALASIFPAKLEIIFASNYLFTAHTIFLHSPASQTPSNLQILQHKISPLFIMFNPIKWHGTLQENYHLKTQGQKKKRQQFVQSCIVNQTSLTFSENVINKQPIIFDHLLHLFIKYFSAVLQLKKRKSSGHFINPIKTTFNHKMSQNKMQKRSTLRNVVFSLLPCLFSFYVMPFRLYPKSKNEFYELW